MWFAILFSIACLLILAFLSVLASTITDTNIKKVAVRANDYERSCLINKIDKESHDKRRFYLSCVKDSIISDSKISYYMSKIDEYLTAYNIEQFDRFYTVYCKELADTIKSINHCKIPTMRESLVNQARCTYGGIFLKMFTEIEAFIKSNTTTDSDIDGIRNFAKINGDFDENYKADATSTSPTSEVENRAKNYASALARAYEEVSQYKKENARLTEELKKCKAEAEKYTNKDNLARVEIDCGDLLYNVDDMYVLMDRVAETVRKSNHNSLAYKLYCNDTLFGAYSGVWKTNFDYDRNYMYYGE